MQMNASLFSFSIKVDIEIFNQFLKTIVFIYSILSATHVSGHGIIDRSYFASLFIQACDI